MTNLFSKLLNRQQAMIKHKYCDCLHNFVFFIFYFGLDFGIIYLHYSHPGALARSGSASAWYADGRGFDPHVRQHSFVEFGLEIISTAILFLPLIQGQLSVTGERMCTK